MPHSVSLHEYEYFRSERLTLPTLLVGARLALFACLNKSEQFREDTPPLYARTSCDIAGSFVPVPGFEKRKAAKVTIGIEASDAWYGQSHYISLASQPDMSLQCRDPEYTELLYTVFFDQFWIKKYGNPAIKGCGIEMTDGFLVDASNETSLISSNAVVSGSRGGDGLPGALVPARPRKPDSGLAATK